MTLAPLALAQAWSARHAVEEVRIEIVWNEPSAEALFQATDTEASAPPLHASGLPDRLMNDVNLSPRIECRDRQFVLLREGAFQFGSGRPAGRGIYVAVDAVVTFCSVRARTQIAAKQYQSLAARRPDAIFAHDSPPPR
jgi:hypothetical protein